MYQVWSGSTMVMVAPPGLSRDWGEIVGRRSGGGGGCNESPRSNGGLHPTSRIFTCILNFDMIMIRMRMMMRVIMKKRDGGCNDSNGEMHLTAGVFPIPTSCILRVMMMMLIMMVMVRVLPILKWAPTICILDQISINGLPQFQIFRCSFFFAFLQFFVVWTYICHNKHFPQENISWRCNRSTGEIPGNFFFFTLNLFLDQFEKQSMCLTVSSGGPKARPYYMRTMKSVEIFKILS